MTLQDTAMVSPRALKRRVAHFRETMIGSVRLHGDHPRPIRMDLSVTTARMLRPTATTEARLSGQICVQGWADDPHATGVMEISPLARGRIYYRLSFTARNRRFILEGWKSVCLRHPLRSMTVLPFTLYDADDESRIGSGRPLGSGTLHFSLATIPSSLASFRFPRGTRPASEFSPRWAGERGRTEVWYTTADRKSVV